MRVPSAPGSKLPSLAKSMAAAFQSHSQLPKAKASEMWRNHRSHFVPMDQHFEVKRACSRKPSNRRRRLRDSPRDGRGTIRPKRTKGRVAIATKNKRGEGGGERDLCNATGSAQSGCGRINMATGRSDRRRMWQPMLHMKSVLCRPRAGLPRDLHCRLPRQRRGRKTKLLSEAKTRADVECPQGGVAGLPCANPTDRRPTQSASASPLGTPQACSPT